MMVPSVQQQFSIFADFCKILLEGQNKQGVHNTDLTE